MCYLIHVKTNGLSIVLILIKSFFLYMCFYFNCTNLQLFTVSDSYLLTLFSVRSIDLGFCYFCSSVELFGTFLFHSFSDDHN